MWFWCSVCWSQSLPVLIFLLSFQSCNQPQVDFTSSICLVLQLDLCSKQFAHRQFVSLQFPINANIIIIIIIINGFPNFPQNFELAECNQLWVVYIPNLLYLFQFNLCAKCSACIGGFYLAIATQNAININFCSEVKAFHFCVMSSFLQACIFLLLHIHTAPLPCLHAEVKEIEECKRSGMSQHIAGQSECPSREQIISSHLDHRSTVKKTTNTSAPSKQVFFFFSGKMTLNFIFTVKCCFLFY